MVFLLVKKSIYCQHLSTFRLFRSKLFSCEVHVHFSPLKHFWGLLLKFYHSKNGNKNLKFLHSMHYLKTHSTVSESFRYLLAFSCNHINKTKRRENIDFFDWTIFLRNYFSKPMKFEYYLLKLKPFQMRPITIFYGKPFFLD